MTPDAPTITFTVQRIIENFSSSTRQGIVSYFDSELLLESTGQTILVRGNPWKVGTKVKFAEILK